MMTPKKLYHRFIDDTTRTVADDNARRQMQYRYVLKFIVLLCSIFFVGDIFIGDYTMAALIFSIGVLFFGNYWIVYLLKDLGVHMLSIMLIIEYFAIFTAVLIRGSGDGFTVIWIAVIPPLIFLMMGLKIGISVGIVNFLQLAFFLWTPWGSSMLEFEYSVYFKERFPLLFVFAFCISLFVELLRLLTLREVHRSQDKIKAIYEKQYHDLNERIQEARRVRHDMRHHFVMINQYLEDGKIDALKDYIQQYYQAIPFEEALIYCEHYPTNALLTYISQRARNENIPCDIKVNFPADMQIPENALTIVLGNLLENAIDASEEGLHSYADFEPEIIVRGNMRDNMLLFSVQNRAAKIAQMDENRRFISSKHEGLGIGIESVKNVCERYHGNVDITQKDGSFLVKVTMLAV